MANERTTSLHERLSPELRRAVERDLVEQPPGRATYQEVYEFHKLAGHGVNIKAVERYGKYLRSMHRAAWIREMGDVIVGEGASPRIEALIRTRLTDALMDDDVSVGELFKAALTEKSLRDAAIGQAVEKRASELHEAKLATIREAAEAAIEKADGVSDPAERARQLREDIRVIYGLG